MSAHSFLSLQMCKENKNKWVIGNLVDFVPKHSCHVVMMIAKWFVDEGKLSESFNDFYVAINCNQCTLFF